MLKYQDFSLSFSLSVRQARIPSPLRSGSSNPRESEAPGSLRDLCGRVEWKRSQADSERQ